MKIVSTLALAVKKIRYVVTGTRKAGMSVLEQTVRNIQERMNVPGKPITYPVNWDSLKQRAAFFATNGFGKGIPYKRTGNTTWSVSKAFENEIDLFAPHPAGAVFGMPTANFWQSRIHRGRWVELKGVLRDEITKLPARLKESLRVVFQGGINA